MAVSMVTCIASASHSKKEYISDCLEQMYLLLVRLTFAPWRLKATQPAIIHKYWAICIHEENWTFLLFVEFCSQILSYRKIQTIYCQILWIFVIVQYDLF